MKEKDRNSIERIIKFPQFTTMNVIDGQAGLVIYSSLIFYSLTIDNILNIIVLLILAGVAIATLTGDNGVLTQSQQATAKTNKESELETIRLAVMGSFNNDGNLNLTMLLSNLENELPDPKTIEPKIENNKNCFPVMVIANYGSYKIDNNGNIKEIENFIIEADTNNLLQGESTIVKIVELPKKFENEEISWKSSDENKLIVNGNGHSVTITALNGGIVDLVANVGEEYSNVYKVSILNRLSNISVDNLEIEEKQTKTIIIPEYTEEIEYSLVNSSDSYYFTVDEIGNVYAVKNNTTSKYVKLKGKISGDEKQVSVTILKVPWAKDYLSKGKYVNYKTKSSEIILCKYLSSSQIISASSVRTVTLGIEDPYASGNSDGERAFDSYMKASVTLNTYAEEYLNSDNIATDARCVGSLPYKSSGKFNLKNNKYIKCTDNLVREISMLYNKLWWLDSDSDSDLNSLNSINDGNVGEYWLASYGAWMNGSSTVACQVKCGCYVNGKSDWDNITRGRSVINISLNNYDKQKKSYTSCSLAYPNNVTHGFRPIFLLNDDAKIISGDGTIGNPYELGL